MSACLVSDFRAFKELDRPVIKRIFGRGRCFKRGRKFAAEGYLDNVQIVVGDGDAVVRASCFASQIRSKKHKVFLAVDTSSFELLENRCSCTAGKGRCSHQAAVYHFLAAGGAFTRSLESNSRSGPASTSARSSHSDSLSCTSQPRTWGIPSRRIEPDRPVEDIDFKKVPEAVEETFDDPVQAKEDNGKDSGSCSEADEVDLQRQKELLESFADEEKPMVLLR